MKRVIEKVFVSITNQCNNCCSYCFQENNNKTQHIDEKVLDTIFKELSDLKVKKVILSGGEATLHPNFDAILMSIEKYDFEVNLFSNGIVSDSIIDLINHSKITTVYLSLDGSNDIYNFSRGHASNNTIEYCIEKLNKRIVIMNTLNSQNYVDVDEFINYCSKNKKIEKINFNPIKILHSSYKEMELSCNMLKKANSIMVEKQKRNKINVRSYYNQNSDVIMNCTAGKTSIAIDLNGDVSGCIFGSSVSVKDFVVGNIFKEKLIDIWNDERRWNIFLTCFDDCCNKCSNYKSNCTGVCCIEKYLAENEGGSYLCEMRSGDESNSFIRES